MDKWERLKKEVIRMKKSGKFGPYHPQAKISVEMVTEKVLQMMKELENEEIGEVSNGDNSYLPGDGVSIERAYASLHDVIAFDPRKWEDHHRDAWIYGIVIGWSDEYMEEFRTKFGWNEKTIEVLKSYHKALQSLNPFRDDAMRMK